MAATDHTQYLHLPIWQEGNITDFFELNNAFTTIDGFAQETTTKFADLSIRTTTHVFGAIAIESGSTYLYKAPKPLSSGELFVSSALFYDITLNNPPSIASNVALSYGVAKQSDGDYPFVKIANIGSGRISFGNASAFHFKIYTIKI